MDITLGRAQTLNDMEIEDANPNENELASLPDLSRNPTMNSMMEPEEYYEVVEKREPVIGDQAEFMRMINEMKKNDKANEQKLENNRANLKKKISAKKEGENQKASKNEESKNDRILRSIAPHVKNYKALNSSNSSDTEVAKLRAECKEKIFKYLLYGIEELKDRKESELNLEEQRISKLSGKDAYAIAKTLVIEIDVDFLNGLNSGNKQIVSKKYKSHLKSLANNISDETNLELRRKILTKEFTGKKLALLNEEEFYPPQVREQLIQKQNILLREAAALDKPMTMVAEEEEYHAPTIEVAVVAEQKKLEEKKSKYKYLEESSILMLRDLLKDDQIKRMRNLLEFEARRDIQERLLENMNKVFECLI